MTFYICYPNKKFLNAIKNDEVQYDFTFNKLYHKDKIIIFKFKKNYKM